MTLVDEFLCSARELGADDTVIQNILNQLLEDYDRRITILNAAKNSTKDQLVRERLSELVVIPFLRCDDVGIQAGFIREEHLSAMRADAEEDIIIPAMDLVKYYHQ